MKNRRVALAGTDAEMVLLPVLRLEMDTSTPITLARINKYMHTRKMALGAITLYKATQTLCNLGLLQLVMPKTIEEAEILAVAAMANLKKPLSESSLIDSDLAYELTENGWRAGLFLFGQKTAIDSLVKCLGDETSRTVLESQIRPAREKFYGDWCSPLGVCTAAEHVSKVARCDPVAPSGSFSVSKTVRDMRR